MASLPYFAVASGKKLLMAKTVATVNTTAARFAGQLFNFKIFRGRNLGMAAANADSSSEAWQVLSSRLLSSRIF